MSPAATIPTAKGDTVSSVRILLLEDSPLDAELACARLARGGLDFTSDRVDTRADFVAAIESGRYDLILADYALPSFDGLAALELARSACPNVPFLFLSGGLGEEVAIESLKRGATDYVLKGRLDRLVPAVTRALAEARERAERRRAESELRQAQARLEEALEAGHIGTWTWDVANDRVQGDRACFRLFAISPEKGDGSPASRFLRAIHPDDRDAVAASLRRAVESGDRFEADYRVVQPDGSVRWVVARSRVVRDDAGRASSLPGVVVDVTERKRAEEALLVQLRLTRTITDNASLALFIIDAHRRCTFMNPAAEALTGFRFAEVQGRSLHDAIHHNRPDGSPYPQEDCPIDRAFLENNREQGEEVFVHKDGHFYPIAFTVSPIREGAAALGAIIEARDITAERRSQAERESLLREAERARAEAEAANRMKDEFLATLSHELRTPLNAILGWAKLLLSGKVDAEDFEDGLAAIERNSRVQAQLIEDLLDISRIISGKLRLDVQRVDLAEVIEAALAAVVPAAEARGVHLHTMLDPLAAPVSGDPARLQQVVWNLLSNAVKFTPKGGRVQVLLERVNSHVEISVIDTGHGIRPEFLPLVFDRFRQADASTTRRHGGLGLGLSIVKQLVEMHGGNVRAKSPGEGLGSTFTVMLPIVVVHHPEPEPEKARPGDANPAEMGCAEEPLRDVRVLVVDDEPDARALAQRVLTGCCAEVRVADSVPEALRVLEKFRPHVLVSDVGMPGEDGYDLIRQIRAGGRSVKQLPAVALTAFARAEDRKRAMLAGFQTHVAKPVDPEELVAVVASLAGRTGGS